MGRTPSCICQLSCRACWVTQAATGCAVQPAKRTRRARNSMKKKDRDGPQGQRLDRTDVPGEHFMGVLPQESVPGTAASLCRAVS